MEENGPRNSRYIQESFGRKIINSMSKRFSFFKNTVLQSLYSQLIAHFQAFSLILGSIIVSIWTMILFFAKPTTFDLIGQQLLSHQWITGFHNGATLGPTNYILKIIFLYIPLNYLPGSPRLKLILMTL